MTAPRAESYYAQILNAYKRREICRALVDFEHNRSHAARGLGVSRRSFLLYLRQFALKTRAAVNEAAAETDAEIHQRIGKPWMAADQLAGEATVQDEEVQRAENVA